MKHEPIQQPIHAAPLAGKQYALFSVSDTEGAAKLATFLQGRGLGLLATGSTARTLRAASLEVEAVADFTGSPEILDGRVKTLHPKIHGSLLYLRDNHQHIAESQRSGLRDIAVVVVNLYPFAQAAAQTAYDGAETRIIEHIDMYSFAQAAVQAAYDGAETRIIEHIDVGGPAMLRSAAKNYQNVSVLCQPSDYTAFIAEWQRNGEVSLETRRKLAAKVYGHTAQYDAMIANWLNHKNGELFPQNLLLAGTRTQVTRYGENPHQAGAIYKTASGWNNSEGIGLTANCQQLHGKEMSYNNFLDADAALGFLQLFGEQAAIIVKHQNPCGSAIQCSREESLCEIYQRALACDTASAFGGIVAFNREVPQALAAKLCETFYEIVLAPNYSEAALHKLQSKKNLRILRIPSSSATDDFWNFRSISGGFAIQTRDHSLQHGAGAAEHSLFRCVSKAQATEQDLQQLLFAQKIASRVKSNAIVLSRDLAAPGIGAGQMSRIDALRIAAQKMEAMGFALQGCYMASDAFFPFRDAVDLAAQYGVRAIIQPGGSVRDHEVIQAADEHGLIMVCTGVRHFYH